MSDDLGPYILQFLLAAFCLAIVFGGGIFLLLEAITYFDSWRQERKLKKEIHAHYDFVEEVERARRDFS